MLPCASRNLGLAILEHKPVALDCDESMLARRRFNQPAAIQNRGLKIVTHGLGANQGRESEGSFVAAPRRIGLSRSERNRRENFSM
jgi:hypothetical protein